MSEAVLLTQSETVCPKCSSRRVRRCRRNTWERVVEQIVRLKAYHCGECKHRFTTAHTRDY